MARENQSRCWCWTLNNYTAREIKELEEKPTSTFRYMIYGLEVGEEGTPHLQGYLEFTKGLRFRQVQQFFANPRVWFERKSKFSTRTQSRDYCKKDKHFFEFGTWIEDGQRTDLEMARQMISDGATQLEIANEHFGSWVRYHKAFELYRIMLNKNKERDLICNVFHGPTGTGKTRKAIDLHHEDFFIITQGNNGVWFDGYHGEKHLIIDDFFGWIKYTHLLRILDRYPLNTETKGGHVLAEWKHVTITSNSHPRDWYTSRIWEGSPLQRRIDSVVELTEPYTWFDAMDTELDSDSEETHDPEVTIEL